MTSKKALFFCFALLFTSGSSFAAPISAVFDKTFDIGGEGKNAECTTCRFLIELLHDLFGTDENGGCIIEILTYLCTRLHIEDHFICQGIASDFKDIFVYVIGELVVNPNELCGLLIHDCGSVFNPFNASWSLPIPPNKPPYRPPQLPQPNAPKLKVLHLSDLHFDMDYIVGAEADCGEPLCCRPARDGHERTDPVKVPAGPWGHIGNCDAPYWLGVNMMQHIANTHRDLDYVVVSGDYESHAVWDYKQESHMAVIRNVSTMVSSFLPNVPIYWAVGNHEGVPIDTFAPHFVPEKFWMDWLYGTMADSWKQWIPDDQEANVRYRGCYVKKIYPGLRIISLNNGIGGDTYNFYLYINQTDPDGTMTWLIDQLSAAEAAGDKVHIVAHIPGADSEMLEGWALMYYKVVNRFENTIAAQFFGHTHSDRYYITYLDPDDFRSRPTSVIFSAPSLTPQSDFNPAYRVYTIDGNYPGSSFQILDFENWFLNLTEANANYPASPVWKRLYAAKQDYGLTSMFPSEWNGLIERFKTDDALFNNYVKFFYRQSNMPCDANCKAEKLCGLRKFHHADVLCSDLNAQKVTERQRKRATPWKAVDLRKETLYLQQRKAKDDKCPI